MMGLLILCLVIMTSLTPLNLALSLTTISITLGLMAYSLSLSVFPSAMIMISFSSGTMILFCYCAMMTNYVQKSSKSTLFNLILMMSMPMIMSMSKSSSKMDSTLLIKTMSTSSTICLTMGVVVLSMVCINKTMYKKEKPLKMSY